MKNNSDLEMKHVKLKSYKSQNRTVFEYYCPHCGTKLEDTISQEYKPISNAMHTESGIFSCIYCKGRIKV